MKIYLDFETRSRVDLPKVGVTAYSRHPSTEIVCAAVAVDDSHVTCYHLLSSTGCSAFSEFVGGIPEDAIWCAHNAMFERTMWEGKLFLHYAMPKHWRCSAEIASSLSLPVSLAELAKVLNIGEDKDMDGRRLMLKMCKPKADGTFHELVEDTIRLMKYCMQDVVVDRKIFKLLPDLSPINQRVSEATHRMNTLGLGIDMELVDAALFIAEENDTCLTMRTKELSNGYLERVSQRDAVTTWCKAHGVNLPDYTKKTVEEFSKSEFVPPVVREILEIRLQMGKTSVAKYARLKEATIPVDFGRSYRLRDNLRFHAASTGRWGGKLVQIQNLPRGNIKDTAAAAEVVKSRSYDLVKATYKESVADVLSSCIRAVIVAAPGKKLLVGDYKSIEARVLAWVAGDEKTLKRYREKADLYVEMAKIIYGKTDGITKEERQLGKSAVLGCGYGMGIKRFAETANVSVDLATKAVQAYRQENFKVTKLWQDLERTATTCVYTWKPVRCGAVLWKPKTVAGLQAIGCVLPSGRELTYIQPQIQDEKFSFMCWSSMIHKWEREKVWGGLLTENVVQAIAYDLLADAVCNMFRLGYDVLMTIHDEIIAEESVHGRGVEQFLKDMQTIPAWAAGCPVEAEGWEGERYKK